MFIYTELWGFKTGPVPADGYPCHERPLISAMDGKICAKSRGMFIYTELWGFKTGPVPADGYPCHERPLISAMDGKICAKSRGSKCSPLLSPPDAHGVIIIFGICREHLQWYRKLV